MAITKIHAIKSTLGKALAYIENPDKTDGQMLVSGYNCEPQTASIDFEMTAVLAHKARNLKRKRSTKDRFFYSAKHAQASVDRRRSESRKGLSNHGRAASGVRYSADKTGEERTTFDAHLRYTQGRNSGQFNGRIQSLGIP